MWHSYIFRKCCKFWHHTPLSCQKRCSKIQKMWHRNEAPYGQQISSHMERFITCSGMTFSEVNLNLCQKALKLQCSLPGRGLWANYACDLGNYLFTEHYSSCYKLHLAILVLTFEPRFIIFEDHLIFSPLKGWSL